MFYTIQLVYKIQCPYSMSQCGIQHAHKIPLSGLSVNDIERIAELPASQHPSYYFTI